jgi:hypothetical protein
MSWNRVRVVVVSLAGLGVLALGCGGSSSSKATDPVALCNQTCDKVSSLCAAGLPTAQVEAGVALCKTQCQTQAGSAAAACSNSAAILAAYQQCLTKNTCAELTSCADAAPECVGSGAGGGAGGARGTGGTGSGGSTGAASGGASGASGGVSGSGGVGNGGSAGAGGAGLPGLDGGIPGFDGSIPGFDGGFSLDGLTVAGTCADLLACCNALADATSKADCLSAYNTAKPFGDTVCGAAYSGLKQGGTCQ